MPKIFSKFDRNQFGKPFFYLHFTEAGIVLQKKQQLRIPN